MLQIASQTLPYPRTSQPFIGGGLRQKACHEQAPPAARINRGQHHAILSPALFGDAFAAAGIDGFYHLMDVDRLPERRLAKLLDAIKAAGFAGANIT